VAPAPCVEGARPACGTGADGVLLQRTGARPLRVTGIVLACLDDSCRPAWSRIRLALYRCDDGDHVAEMRCEQGGGDGLIRPWCAASRHKTRAAALQALEAASPAPERVAMGSAEARLHDAIMQFRQQAAQFGPGRPPSKDSKESRQYAGKGPRGLKSALAGAPAR